MLSSELCDICTRRLKVQPPEAEVKIVFLAINDGRTVPLFGPFAGYSVEHERWANVSGIAQNMQKFLGIGVMATTLVWPKCWQVASMSGQVARWPGGQVARRPGGQEARRQVVGCKVLPAQVRGELTCRGGGRPYTALPFCLPMLYSRYGLHPPAPPLTSTQAPAPPWPLGKS